MSILNPAKKVVATALPAAVEKIDTLTFYLLVPFVFAGAAGIVVLTVFACLLIDGYRGVLDWANCRTQTYPPPG